MRIRGYLHVRLMLVVVIGLGLANTASVGVEQDPSPPQKKPPAGKWEKHYYDRVAQFEKENAAKRTVVMVGSSHIERFDAARMLPDWQVTNRGIASDRIGIDDRGILHRLDNSVFDCNPGVVVLQNGANDLGELWRHGTPSIDEIETCFRKVVRTIRTRLPDTPLIINGLFPTRDKYAELVPLIKKLDPKIKAIAEEFDCVYLEVYSHFADRDGLLREEFSREGLHMTDAGYKVWADLIDKTLTSLVNADAKLTPSNALISETATREPNSDLLWYDAKTLAVEGKGWTDTKSFYERLPARAESMVPEMVWTLNSRTAGIAIRFVTNSKRIGAVWDGGGAMNHMAATGNSGLDLYAKRDGRWVFCGVGRPTTTRTTAILANNLGGGLTEFLLYLPLYNSVTELRIGIDEGTMIAPPPPRLEPGDKPIVFYGTSITQGGCASRSGMSHPSILGRWLDREVINLGFSGSGKMEPELAQLLCELDASLFVLECLPNMSTEMVRDRVQPFVKTLRDAHPTTPILLVESPLNVSNNPGNQVLRKAYNALLRKGVGQLHYLPGDSQLSGNENGTVDGLHPTDLGFYRMAKAYEPIVRSILAAE